MLFVPYEVAPPARAPIAPIPSSEMAGSVRVTAVRWNHRKIPVSRGCHVIGRFAPRPGHRRVAYESLLERSALASLAALPQCAWVATQPFTVEYAYLGASYRYTPDILAVFKPVPHDLLLAGYKKFTTIEIKPDRLIGPWAERLPQRREAVLLATHMPLLVLGETAIASLVGSKCHGT